MATASACLQIDPVLVPFVQASNEKRAQVHLERLVHHYAEPMIFDEVRHHAGEKAVLPEADLRSETVRLLLQRVSAIRYKSAPPIKNLVAYIRMIVRHLCWMHARDTRREQTFSSLPDGTVNLLNVSNPELNEVVERRNLLQALWTEICALPQAQRMALLCNFRDKNGANALLLLALCQIVTPAQLADALGISIDKLEEFSDQLSMEDSQIAASLNISAREVISLRLAARQRLIRRVRAWTNS